MAPEWWQAYLRFRHGLISALDDRYYTAEWLDTRVAEGSAFILWNDNSAIVAEMKEYPTGARVIQGICATGKIKNIAKLVPEAEELAKAQGCTSAFIQSRLAWQQILKDQGYVAYQVTVRKEF